MEFTHTNLNIFTCHFEKFGFYSILQAYELNNTACICPDLCNSVWYMSEITQGTYPNPVVEYPPSIRKRPEFRDFESESQFKEYAK